MKRRLLSLLLAALLLCTATGCEDLEDTGDLLNDLAEFYQEENQEPEPEPLTAFTLPYVAGQSLDPLAAADQVQWTLGTLLYEGLFTLNAAYEPVPVLAESWQYDREQLIWTIRLKSGVMFSDGTALTAQDVAASLERARTSRRYSGRLQEVTAIAVQGNAVVITLSEALATLPWRLDIPIVKAGTERSTVPTGTGAYVYQADTAGAYLLANPRWHQGLDLPLERIELQHCKDPDSALYAFTSREVQLLLLDLTGSDSGVSAVGDYHEAATTIMQFIGVNSLRQPLTDPALRRALSAGIDRETVVSFSLLDHGAAAQLPASPTYSGYDASLETPYSAAAYARLLAEALPESEEVLSLTLLVNEENSFKVSAAQEVAASLSTSRLQVTVETVPWSTFTARLLSGSFDLYYGECRLTADWDIRPLVDTYGYLNYGGYSNGEMDTLVANYRAASEERRPQALLALWQQFLEDAPFLPVCFKSTTLLTTTGVVTGQEPTAADPFYNFEDWQIRLDK